MTMALQKPTVRDRQRWYLWRSEKPLEEIAARERASVETIRKSIDRVEAYRFIASVEEVDVAYNHLALNLIEDQENTLRSAMVAETWRTFPDGRQESIPDHLTRLKAIDTARELIEVTRPRVPSTQVNVQQNVASGVGASGGMSFEQRLREIRAKREVQQIPGNNPMLLEAPPQMTRAEKIVAEFEEAGIDLEDGDLEDLEEGDDDEAS